MLPPGWQHGMPFTSVLQVLCAAGGWHGRASWAWRVGACLAVFVMVSFHVAGACDPTAFARMRRRRGWGLGLFYAGHALFHGVPFACAFALPPVGLQPVHVVHALGLYGGWAVATSNGSLCFDDVYVPLDAETWYRAQVVGSVAMGVYGVAVSERVLASPLT